MNDQPDNTTPPVDQLARLLARCAVRQAPPSRVEAEVRAAVHAEWLHLHHARTARRQRRWLAAAATLIVGVGIGWLAHNLSNPPGAQAQPAAIIADLTHVQGVVMLNDLPLSSPQSIHVGDTLRSAADGGARIELNNGVSVRLAPASVLHWLQADAVRLAAGSLYVDSHAHKAAFVVRTVHGEVTHLGTRYLVSSDAQQLRVAVREGRAAIRVNNQELTVDPQQQLRLRSDGVAHRDSVALDDASWQWADALSEPFVLENRSVDEFLHWVAQETGYELVYASSKVQADASKALLHGQRTTRPPLQALQMVLSATDFRAVTRGRQLVVTEPQ